MKLSLADARKLQRLGRGEKLPSSQFNNALSALLLEEEVCKSFRKGVGKLIMSGIKLRSMTFFTTVSM